MYTFRVRTVMENLEKSWNFEIQFPGPGKVLEFYFLTKVLEKFWNFKMCVDKIKGKMMT